MNKSAQRRGIASSAAVQRTMPRLARLGLGLSILACVLPARAEVGTGPRDAPPDLAVLLIRDELVQKELGLRPGQLERIEKILADHDEKIFAFHLQTPKSSATALRGVLERLERRLSAVLTSEQHKRLTQIALQSRGTFGMLSPVVVRQLKLTEEEKKKVKAAAQEAYARRASIAAGNRGDEPSVSAAALEEAKTAEEEALREAIGPERLQKWYEILGRPFPVEKLRPPAVRAPALRPELTWIKGSAVSLDKLRGRVVLLHFWSADCDECRPNYPIIARWAEELKSRGLTVIGVRVPAENPIVGTNGAAEPSPEPAPEAPMDYAVGADDAKTTWQAWVSPPLPTTYLIDRRGFVRYWWVGEMNVRKVSGETFLHERLEELLKEP